MQFNFSCIDLQYLKLSIKHQLIAMKWLESIRIRCLVRSLFLGYPVPYVQDIVLFFLGEKLTKNSTSATYDTKWRGSKPLNLREDTDVHMTYQLINLSTGEYVLGLPLPVKWQWSTILRFQLLLVKGFFWTFTDEKWPQLFVNKIQWQPWKPQHIQYHMHSRKPATIYRYWYIYLYTSTNCYSQHT